MKALLIMFLAVINSVAFAQQYNWTFAGPEGGVIKSLYIKENGIIYAGTEKGVYLSDNLAQSWNFGNENIYKGINSVSSIGTIIVAAPVTGGIFSSTDNGYSFYQVNSQYTIKSLCKSFNILYGGLEYSATTSGVIYSIDNGQMWNTTNLPGAAGVNEIYSKDSLLVAACNTGIFMSAYPGIFWNKKDNGIPINAKVYSVSNSGSTFIAGTSIGVYRSTDTGNNWTPVNNGLPTVYPYYAVIIHDNRFFACNYGKSVYSSTNGGNTWFEVNSGLNNNLINKFQSYNNYLFASTLGGGVFVTVDYGTNWFPKNTGLKAHLIYTMLSYNNILFAGTQGGGVYTSTNAGSNWNTANYSLENTIVYSLHYQPPYIFAGTYGGIFRTSNYGLSWQAVNNNLNDSVVLSLGSSGANTFAGTRGGGIYKSTDLGTNWQKITGNIFNDTIYAIANIRNILFASSKRYGVVRSNDNGSSWQTVLSNYSPQIYSAFSVEDTVIYTTIINAGYYDFYRSTNFGTNWTSIYNNPTYTSAYAVETRNNYVIYTKTYNNDAKVFATTNRGSSWFDISYVAGVMYPWYKGTDIKSLKIHDGYLFAGTSGKSIWRIPVSLITSEENISSVHPDTYGLEQNFPNPFNPVTKITFSVPVKGFVTLKIYDIQGKEIATLHNEILSPGVYETVWDASLFPSGIYFCRMKSSEFSDTKRLVLVR